MNNLEDFVSKNGARHYNLKLNKEKIKLVKSDLKLSFKKYLCFKNKKIRIFEPDFPIFWTVKT